MSRIEELEKKLAADPNSRIFVQLAEEYRKQGLLDNAIEICEQGLTKHPQYPSARVALGRALLEAESFDRASEEFESVLAQIPDNILANKFLGETYHRLGRYDDAIQKYQIAQTLSPDDTELEGKIEAVKAEQAAGGPVPTPPEPAVETTPVQPTDAGSAATPATPMGLSLGAPSAPIPATPEPLERTVVDARAFTDDAPEAPPPPPLPDAPPASPGAPGEAQVEAEPQEEAAPPQEELAPIPLVEVDEPMVLEGSSYSNVTTEPEPPPLERVEVISSMEAFQMTPPAPPEPPPAPDALDPNPPPMEPPSMEQAPPAPPFPPPAPVPTTDDASAAPLMDTPAPAAPEPEAFDATPIQPVSPVETAAAEAPATSPDSEAGDDIDTPTMAELYASQGHLDKAVLVYRNLIVREPNETKYLERIEELEMLANASAESATATPGGRVEPPGDAPSDASTRETIEVLEQWLDVIRRSRRA